MAWGAVFNDGGVRGQKKPGRERFAVGYKFQKTAANVWTMLDSTRQLRKVKCPHTASQVNFSWIEVDHSGDARRVRVPSELPTLRRQNRRARQSRCARQVSNRILRRGAKKAKEAAFAARNAPVTAGWRQPARLTRKWATLVLVNTKGNLVRARRS